MTERKKPTKKKATAAKPRETWNDKLSRIRKKATAVGARNNMQNGYRSGLEVKAAMVLEDAVGEDGYIFEGKDEILTWTPLPIPHKYHPDYVLTKPMKSGKKLIIETKGRFMPDDMAKQLAIKVQHPEVEIRFVFTRSNTWFRKAKTRTYAKWCEENGFKYCDFKDFPEVLKKWLRE